MARRIPKADKTKGYYGDQPVKKAQGTGGLVMVAKGMQPPVKVPCKECPIRRSSVPCYLGGYDAQMYLDAMRGPASIACHSSPGFHEGIIHKQKHCTGVAAFRANVGYDLRAYASYTAMEAIGRDIETYFATEDEFRAHHNPRN